MDLLNEELLTFAQAARLSRCHIATVNRWRIDGRRGIKLEAFLKGGRWCTTRESLERFFLRVTGEMSDEWQQVRSAGCKRRGIRDARQVLREKGFYRHSADSTPRNALPGPCQLGGSDDEPPT
jgi:hypothetical protein